jgi:hypothetical protein
MRSKLQSILFDRRKFTIRSAIDWLINHNFKHNKVDIKSRHFRFRQYDPSPYHRFRTITLTYGIQAILEF